MTPRTTFANGINPFAQLAAMPEPTQPEPIMPKPAKPAKAKPKLEDYSTPYKPPALVIVATTVPDDLVNFGLTITNDPLPTKRMEPRYKYHPVFDAMKPGQCVRVPAANVGKVAHAMRKYIEIKGAQAHVKSQPRYCEDEGFGRVWLLAGVSQIPKRKSSVRN